MPYAIIYRVRYQDDQTGQTIRIDISDNETFTSDPIEPSVFLLEAAKPALKIYAIDNDRLKFKPIRAKGAEINFKPTYQIAFGGYVTASTFMGAADDRWIVDITIEETGFTLFKGFLVSDDHQQPFIPSSHKQTITLTATDNLGTLTEVPLTDADGLYIRGKNSILSYVLYALRKTNLPLNVIITNTWFEESQTDFECAWENLFLDGKAFENRIGEAVDCYTALEMILKAFCCSLSQYDKTWFISSIDEKTGGNVYRFEYEITGVHVVDHTPAPLVQTLGKNEDLKFAFKDCILSYSRPNKFNRLYVRYQLPLEIIDNMDFSRGTDDIVPIVVDLSLFIKTYDEFSDFPAAGQYSTTYKATDTGNHYRWNGSSYILLTAPEVPTGVAYVFEDWEEKKGNPDSPAASTSTSYIAKIYQYGDERERYLVLTNPTVATVDRSYVESNPVPVRRQDKFVASVDFRTPTNITNGGAPMYVIMSVRLKGEDGSNWWLGLDTNMVVKWFSSNSTWSAFSFHPGPAIPLTFNGTVDTRDWRQCSWDAPPCPVNGELFIMLNAMNSQSNTGSTWDDSAIHYANLQFEHIPFINGSYQRYTGHSNKVEQDGNFKANVDEEMMIGDSPHPIFKHSIFKEVGGQYVLTERWYMAGYLLTQFVSPPIPDEHLHSLGWLQVFAYWNQNSRAMLTLSGTVYGMKLTGDTPELIHDYQVNDPNDEVDLVDKSFMLTNREIDPETGVWKAELTEVYDAEPGKYYNYTHTFKYEME